MGGPIAIVVRDKEGTVHAFDAWTSYISMFFDNARFLDERPGHLDFLRKEIEHLWEDDGYNGRDRALVAPDCCGLVLGDMQEKVILSSQGYHHPGKVIGASVSLSMTDHTIGETPGQTEVDIAHELIESGRIKNIEIRGEPVSVEGLTLKEIMDTYHPPGWFTPFSMMIETAPYTIEIFDEDSDGIRSMYARVKELGFHLTDKDEDQWDSYIKELNFEEIS